MTKEQKLLIVVIVVLALIAIRSARGQSGNANFIGSIPGTTVANCGTPTSPSVCSVATGVYIWQSPATGWFQPMPATPSVGGIAGITVNGTAVPVTNGVAAIIAVTNVSINAVTKSGNASFLLSTPSTVTAQ